MTRPRHAFLLLVFLLPGLSWVVSSGGLPFCCWGNSCTMVAADAPFPAAMTGMAPGMAHCVMHMAPRCGVQAPPPLILPSSLMPLAPLARAADGVPSWRPLAGSAASMASAEHAGWTSPVFHPPSV